MSRSNINLFLFFITGCVFTSRAQVPYVPSPDSLKGFDRRAFINHFTQHTQLSQDQLPHFLEQAQKQYVQNKYYSKEIAPTISQTQPACDNLDFESGSTSGWTLNGDYKVVSTGNDFYGGFPKSCPGGNYSLQLGGDTTKITGAPITSTAEQKFIVSKANALLTMNYAMVLLNFTSHTTYDAAKIKIEVFDSKNNLISCASDSIYAMQGTKGLQKSTRPTICNWCGQCGNDVLYLPWTPVTLDLQGYIGKTVTLRVTNKWCLYNVDWAYCYIDCSCNPLEIMEINPPCKPGLPFQLCGPSGLQGYSWTGPAGSGINGQATECITTTLPGYYSLQIQTTGPCPKPIIDTVVVLGTGGMNTDFDILPNTCTDISFKDKSAGNMQTWQWDFGDGSAIETSQNPNHIYASPGTYNVRLIVSSSSGCPDTLIKTFTINKPTADFTATPTCVGNSIVFTDNSTPAGSPATWYYGDGTSDQTGNHIYAADGTYDVKLVVQNGSGCADSLKSNVSVYPKPVPDFVTADVCYGQKVNVKGNSQISSGSISAMDWNYGSATISSLTPPATSFSKPGTYTISLVTTSDKGCVDSVKKNATIFLTPIADFSVAPVCFNTLTVFANTSFATGGGTIAGWSWDFGDAGVSTDENPFHQYAVAGNYTVSLIVNSDKGCKDTIKKTAIVNPMPLPAFASKSGCSLKATFTNSSSIAAPGIINYSWRFGDGVSSIDKNPFHIYASGGTYDIKLVISSDKGCVDSVKEEVTVHDLPATNFSVQPVCYNVSSVFTDISGSGAGGVITNWSWDFGEPASVSNISTQQNPTHTYACSGTYTVTLITVATGGCSDTLKLPAIVNPAPTIAFTATGGCSLKVPFTNQSTISGPTPLNYKWNFGDAGNSIVQVPTHTYATAGTYTITLIGVSDKGCIDSIKHPVTVYDQPSANFSVQPQCLNTQSTFNDLSAGGTGTITGWSWNFGEANSYTNTSASQHPTHTYSSSGTYTVTLITASTGGCTDTMRLPVVVYPLPAVDFSFTPVCEGSPSQFKDLTEIPGDVIKSMAWDFGDNNNNSSTENNPSHTYLKNGSYTVTLTATSANGCTGSKKYPAIIAAVPKPDFSAPGVCLNLPTLFTDASTVAGKNISGWLWDFGDKNTSTLSNPTHIYAAAGIYTVTLTAYSGNCQSTITRKDTVFALPHAGFSASPQPASVLNTSITLTDQSYDGVKGVWDFGDLSTADYTPGINPVHVYPNENKVGGEYYRASLLVINQYGCIDTVSNPVVFTPEFTFFAPNAFTPNGDGLNDQFSGIGIGIVNFEMWIFDRWGNTIFNTKDLNKKWDGKVQDGNDQLAQEDTYVWMVQLSDVLGKKHRFVGHVSLIK